MGVIIKYQLSFSDIGLTISNDLYSGEFIIDADIKAEMTRGGMGCKFSIDLYDLPKEKVEKLYEQLEKDNHRVLIRLGYFDGPFENVMEGVVKKLRNRVTKSKLITTITGFESGTNALLEAKYKNFKRKTFEETLPIKDAFTKLLENAEEGISKTPIVEKNVSSEANLKDITLQKKNLLEILDELAEDTKVELLVCDKTVRLGTPIMDNNYEPTFTPDENLATFQPFTKKIPDEAGRNVLNPLEAKQANGFQFTITGDPKLRPAQKIVAEVNEYNKLSGADFRVHSLVHQFTASGGYICKGNAIKVCKSSECRNQEKANHMPSAERLVRSLSEKVQSQQRTRPDIEVGQVKTYKPEQHLSTLYHGQRFRLTETQPSIHTEVENEEQQHFPNKPIVSPFAWHKCGLVVPVYPGMKALLSHNLNLSNDVLVNGFIWSEEPKIEPPKNKEGDWWLCLPVDFDTSTPPKENTKAVNDITTNNGKRVIEVKGLKVVVGKLPNVGVRPVEGEDDEFLIEHKSGTKFMIASDGELTIEAAKVTIKGNVTIEGNVEII
ncbi:MAG: hypothetical protein GY774_20835 [Planctomycetes bacterium]|nr:hypothetical protein [Planctomycetota bacterium]